MTLTPRILIVDDERHIARLLRVNLERTGHEVCVADTGEEALGHLAKGSFDKAFLDFTMPKPNGYDILEYIRTRDETKDMWVALMVPSSQVEEVMSRPHKADWYSGKPLDPKILEL